MIYTKEVFDRLYPDTNLSEEAEIFAEVLQEGWFQDIIVKVGSQSVLGQILLQIYKFFTPAATFKAAGTEHILEKYVKKAKSVNPEILSSSYKAIKPLVELCDNLIIYLDKGKRSEAEKCLEEIRKVLVKETGMEKLKNIYLTRDIASRFNCWTWPEEFERSSLTNYNIKSLAITINETLITATTEDGYKMTGKAIAAILLHECGHWIVRNEYLSGTFSNNIFKVFAHLLGSYGMVGLSVAGTMAVGMIPGMGALCGAILTFIFAMYGTTNIIIRSPFFNDTLRQEVTSDSLPTKYGLGPDLALGLYIIYKNLMKWSYKGVIVKRDSFINSLLRKIAGVIFPNMYQDMKESAGISKRMYSIVEILENHIDSDLIPEECKKALRKQIKEVNDVKDKFDKYIGKTLITRNAFTESLSPKEKFEKYGVFQESITTFIEIMKRGISDREISELELEIESISDKDDKLYIITRIHDDINKAKVYLNKIEDNDTEFMNSKGIKISDKSQYVKYIDKLRNLLKEVGKKKIKGKQYGIVAEIM